MATCSNHKNTHALAEEAKCNENQIKIFPYLASLANTTGLSVLSFNILYKEFTTHTRYPLVDEEFRSWKHRLPILRDTIASYHADIVCLQEMDLDKATFVQDFGAHFNNLGYDYILPQKNFCHKAIANGIDIGWGNVIFFNKSKYKCIYHERFKNNARMLIALFIDLQTISHCKYCADSLTNNNITCVYHSFFVVNVHLTGHPQKHMQRLHQIKKIVQRLDQFANAYKHKHDKKQNEIANIGFTSNINGETHNMRIIICGDFNAPKTSLCDKLLVNQHINYDKIKINNVSKQGLQCLDSDRIVVRPLRFIFTATDVGYLIGHKGFFIRKLKNVSKAKVIIPTSNNYKRNYKMRNRIVILIGTYLQVLKAISMINTRIKTTSLLMCIDEENIKCLNIAQIYKMGWAKMHISAERLYNSTEKTIDISGSKKAIYSTMKIIVKQLFETKSYVITRMQYVPEAVTKEHNIFRHCYEFRDSYNDGLLSYLSRDSVAVPVEHKNKKCYKMDEYFDRLQHFPTFSDGRIVAAMDFIYFTANNMVLGGITRTVNEDEDNGEVTEVMEKLKVEIDRNRKAMQNNKSDIQMEQGIPTNIWSLPSEKIVSDHLPISAVFTMKDICDKSKHECDCCQYAQSTKADAMSEQKDENYDNNVKEKQSDLP